MREPSRGEETGARRRGLAAGALLLAAVGVAAAANGVAGAERLASRAAADVVLVAEGDVVDDDLYAVGQVITIDGRVEGDLVFWAGQRLVINGEVTGDVTGAAGTMRINGRVGGSVRAVGWDLAAAGSVGRDLLGIGWRVAADGAVGRDVLAWARNLAAAGSVGRDIAGQAWGTALLAGSVGRDVEMTVGRLRVSDGADIAEDLVYRSPRLATMSEQAAVGGNLIRRHPLVPNLSVGAARTSAAIAGWLLYMLLGLLFIRVFPSHERTAERVRARPWRSLGLGSTALLGVPLPVALLPWAIIAFSGWSLWAVLGAALLGIILALGLLLAVTLYSIPALMAFGGWLSRGRLSPYGAFALTSGAVGLSLFAPFYIGPALLGASALFGAGGRWVKMKEKAALEPGNTG